MNAPTKSSDVSSEKRGSNRGTPSKLAANVTPRKTSRSKGSAVDDEDVSESNPRIKRIAAAKGVIRTLRERRVRDRKGTRDTNRADSFKDDTPELHQQLEAFFEWLATSRVISPKLADKSKLKSTLEIAMEELPDLPESLSQSLREVYNKLDGMGWNTFEADDGQEESDDERREDEEANDQDASDMRTDTDEPDRKRRKSESAIVEFPPEDHAIWGKKGIMHGMALKRGNDMRYILNPDYAERAKNCKVYGDDHLELGSWFPRQLSARFHGYHGEMVRGIHSKVKKGAYSIVLANTYSQLDKDQGDVVYYSGPESLSTKDSPNTKDNPAEKSHGTKALQKNLDAWELNKFKPVRVLRSQSKSPYAPKVGSRYDGLYEVVEAKPKTNLEGGPYQEFKLVRVTGQKALKALQADRPTPQEVEDFGKIKEMYEPARTAPYESKSSKED